MSVLADTDLRAQVANIACPVRLLHGAHDALMPVETATCVRIRGGKTETMDGPFAETKEQLGGYYLLDCPDLDTALKYAAMIPVAEHGTIEVRPVMDLNF